MSSLKGKQLGKWLLLERLGEGGNAQVWKARHEDSRIAAVKVLFKSNPDAEQYGRFKNEVEVLMQLGEVTGILPLLDYNFPDSSEQIPRPWFAMPLATGISEALEAQGQTLKLVVEAVVEIAETLRCLHNKGISHRDIKPNNLYFYNGAWAVGDFGLADFEDKTALTKSGRWLGPLHFMAPEMLAEPTKARGEPADVYSLAKTLWVLASGQRWAPPGELRVDVEQLTLRAYVDDDRVHLIDLLLERATRHNPTNRPTMAEFAQELRAWLPSAHVVQLPAELSDLFSRIAAAAEPSRRQASTYEHQIAEGQKLLDDLRKLLLPLGAELAKSGYSTGAVSDNGTVLEDCKFYDGTHLSFRNGCCIVVQSPGDRPVYLWSGVGIEVLLNGKVNVIAAHIISVDRKPHQICWSQNWLVELGSASQEQALRDVVAGLHENLRSAVECFTIRMEQHHLRRE